MNQELQKKLIEWMSGLEKAGTQAIEFSKGQLPDLFQQIVTFAIYREATYLVMCLMASACGCFLLRLGAKNLRAAKDKNEYDSGEAYIPPFVIGSFTIAISFLIVALNIETLIMAVVAPKLYIIEYMKAFLK